MRKTRKKLLKIGKRTVKNPFEYEIYEKICALVSKTRVEYETEKFPYTTTHTYLPDFKIKTKSGKTIYIEVKGNGRSFDHSVRQKMIAVKDQQNIDLRIVFHNDGKIGRKRKDGSFNRQSDWAIKNGFQFAIREVPKEWFDE